MFDQIQSALGIFGVKNANALTQGFINQFNNQAEYRAALDDYKNAAVQGVLGFENFINNSRDTDGMAEVKNQSGVKLASMNAEFPREAVKGAYGANGQFYGRFITHAKHGEQHEDAKRAPRP
jgi:hypothetical protein